MRKIDGEKGRGRERARPSRRERVIVRVLPRKSHCVRAHEQLHTHTHTTTHRNTHTCPNIQKNRHTDLERLIKVCRRFHPFKAAFSRSILFSCTETVGRAKPETVDTTVVACKPLISVANSTPPLSVVAFPPPPPPPSSQSLCLPCAIVSLSPSLPLWEEGL